MSSENKKLSTNNISDYDFKKLKLKFLDKNEIEIFSTLCQDSIFSIDEILFNKGDKMLIATFSRFCWEFGEKKIKDNTFYRVVSGIRICNVKDLKFINIDNIDTSKFINLLSVKFDANKNEIIFYFSSDFIIKLAVEKIKIFLDDLDMPWPTVKKPMHK